MINYEVFCTILLLERCPLFYEYIYLSYEDREHRDAHQGVLLSSPVVLTSSAIAIHSAPEDLLISHMVLLLLL